MQKTITHHSHYSLLSLNHCSGFSDFGRSGPAEAEAEAAAAAAAAAAVVVGPASSLAVCCNGQKAESTASS